MKTTFERIRDICTDVLGVDKDAVTEASEFIDDLGADSLDLVELIMCFEDEFACEVSDEEASNWLLVSDAVKFADKLIAVRAS